MLKRIGMTGFLVALGACGTGGAGGAGTGTSGSNLGPAGNDYDPAGSDYTASGNDYDRAGNDYQRAVNAYDPPPSPGGGINCGQLCRAVAAACNVTGADLAECEASCQAEQADVQIPAGCQSAYNATFECVVNAVAGVCNQPRTVVVSDSVGAPEQGQGGPRGDEPNGAQNDINVDEECKDELKALEQCAGSMQEREPPPDEYTEQTGDPPSSGPVEIYDAGL